MERTFFTKDHDLFRDNVKKWLDKEIVPFHEKWEEQKQIPKEIWRRAGELGFLCTGQAEEYGGLGADFLYSVIITEEVARAGASGLAIGLHSDIIAPYIEAFGSEEQKKKYLPKAATGECILAVAMTEPNTGSDLAAIRTTAIKDGDHYVINGTKTFISNGQICDLVIVAVKTDPEAGHGGVSLMLVEAGTPGFTKGQNLKKVGMHAQDTSEMHFEDCRVPLGNLLGVEGAGFMYLMQKLQQERLICAIGAQAASEAAWEVTKNYCLERQAFGKPIAKFQNTQFKLVEMATEIEIGRVFLDRVIQDHMDGKVVVKETSMAKYWITEKLNEIVNQCVQLHGGYGYMLEYPIAKAYLDARIQTIFAGTTEIMKIIIAKQIGL